MRKLHQHPRAAGMSDRVIAEHVGVHPDTVGELKRKLQPEPTIGIRQSPTRTGRDGKRGAETARLAAQARWAKGLKRGV